MTNADLLDRINSVYIDENDVDSHQDLQMFVSINTWKELLGLPHIRLSDRENYFISNSWTEINNLPKSIREEMLDIAFILDEESARLSLLNFVKDQ